MLFGRAIVKIASNDSDNVPDTENLTLWTEFTSKSSIIAIYSTVKPVLSCHSKIEKMKVLKTGGSLMQV